MSAFRYTPPGASTKPPRAVAPPRQPAAPVQRNVEAVLSLGDTRYITYRNRVYRIPPVPFKLGQRVLDSYTKSLALAKQVVRTGAAAPANDYYRELGALARLLWQHVRPCGRVRRAAWRVGLLTNPFARASEQELKEITDFFLQGRTMSSVRSLSEQEAAQA